MSDMKKNCNDNDGFIESFIKSPQVKQLLRKREYCFTDFQKAAIIYHSNVNLPQMHHSLRVIADNTCDEELKAQITELIDQDTKSYDRFVHDSKGYIYKLIAKEEESDGETFWFDIGYYDNGTEPKQAGTGSGGAFRIEKYLIAHVDDKHPGKERLNRNIYHSPVDVWYFDEDGMAEKYHTIETRQRCTDDMKPNGRESFENAFIAVPNPFDEGDVVRDINTGFEGVVVTSRDEWRNLCDMATDGRHTLDWNDACIVVNDIETDFRHEHVNPIYLELIN